MNADAHMYGRSSSSVVESMNGANNEARKVYGLDFLTAAYRLLELEQERFQRHQAAAVNHDHALVDHALASFNANVARGAALQVLPQSESVFHVKSSKNTYVVELCCNIAPGGAYGTCTCGRSRMLHNS